MAAAQRLFAALRSGTMQNSATAIAVDVQAIGASQWRVALITRAVRPGRP